MKGNATGPFIITIVGAESSGKTTLAAYLADCLRGRWIKEYAREYLDKLDREYDFEDLEKIARNSLNPFTPSMPFTPPTLLERGKEVLSTRSIPNSLKGGIEELIDFLKRIDCEVVIVDGGMLTIKMWAKIKYGKEIPYVEEELKKDNTSLYVLCRPRKEWESDPQREAPALVDRVWIFNQYLHQLISMKVPFVMVRMSG